MFCRVIKNIKRGVFSDTVYFSSVYTVACLPVRLELGFDLVFGWSVVMHTYLFVLVCVVTERHPISDYFSDRHCYGR